MPTQTSAPTLRRPAFVLGRNVLVKGKTETRVCSVIEQESPSTWRVEDRSGQRFTVNEKYMRSVYYARPQAAAAPTPQPQTSDATHDFAAIMKDPDSVSVDTLREVHAKLQEEANLASTRAWTLLTMIVERTEQAPTADRDEHRPDVATGEHDETTMRHAHGPTVEERNARVFDEGQAVTLPDGQRAIVAEQDPITGVVEVISVSEGTEGRSAIVQPAALTPARTKTSKAATPAGCCRTCHQHGTRTTATTLVKSKLTRKWHKACTEHAQAPEYVARKPLATRPAATPAHFCQGCQMRPATVGEQFCSECGQ